MSAVHGLSDFVPGLTQVVEELEVEVAGRNATIQYQDEGVDVSTKGAIQYINFTGTGVTVTSPSAGVLVVDVPSSGGITIGSTAITSGTNDRPLYQAAGVVTQSTKWRFDGSDMTLIDPTAAVGPAGVDSPRLYFEGAMWRTDTSASMPMKIRTGITASDSGTAALDSPQLYVDFWSPAWALDWVRAITYGHEPSYTNTRLKLANPTSQYWGGMVDISYIGEFFFKDLSGNPSAMAGLSFGKGSTLGYEQYYVNSYSPEIRTHFGSPILFAAGRPFWKWGDNAGNLGSEYVQSDLPIGIGTTSAPSDRLHIQTSSNAALGARIINAGTGATARTHLRIGESVAGDQLFTLMYANTGNSAYGGNTAVMAAGTGASGGLMFAHEGNYPIYFLTNGGNYRMAIHGGGNVTVGSAFDSFTAKFAIVSTTEQLRLVYDGSNYFKTTVGATGIVTLDAVGSGAKFVFSDAVEINGSLTLSAQNIVTDTTTGMKIGTGTTQKLGFFNATPVTQRANIGALTDLTGGTIVTTLQDCDSGGVADVSTVNDNFAGVLSKINKLEAALKDLGFSA